MKCWQRIRAAIVVTLLGLVPTFSAGAITSDAQSVIDRYLEVTGGREAAEAVRSLRVRSKISAMGFDGTLTLYVQKPGLRLSVTELGPFKMSEGYDGRQAWRTDPTSGKLVILEGKDRESAIGDAYFASEMWLNPDQGGATIIRLPDDRGPSGWFQVLEVSPPGGRSRRLWFNRTTGLLDRMEMRADHQHVVSHLSGFRTVAGRLMPFHSRTEIAEMPANTMIAQVDSVWVNESFADHHFTPPGSKSLPARYLLTPGYAEIPFAYRARHVWLRVSINGSEPADFLYDTGASVTVLDSAFADRLGLKTRGRMQSQGAGAVGSASFAELDSLTLVGGTQDGVQIPNLTVAVLSLSQELAPFFWRELAGVVGYDVISRFVNEVDYDDTMIRLYDPTPFAYEGKGQPIALSLAGTMPAIRMKLDGIEGAFRIDVGSSATVDLHRPFVERHGLRDKLARKIEVISGGFGGTFTSEIGRMRRIELGPFGWRDPIVSLSGATAGAFASEDYAGNIGNQILERFTCTFDYDRRVLHLEPSSRYARPDPFTRAGVQLARYGEVVRAMQVIPDSPAEQAGLRTGDEVLAIAGEPAISYSPEALRVLFEEGAVGEAVTVEIDRSGVRKRVKIRLRDML